MESQEREFAIGASPELIDTGTRVLKHADTFLVCDQHGDVTGLRHGQLGLFHHGMRHLSRFRLRLGGQPLLLLRSTVREDNVLLAIELMNPDTLDAEGVPLEHGTIHVRRERLLYDGTLHERITLKSYASRSVPLVLSLEIAADFIDLFEVRGTPRERRGIRSKPEHRGRTLVMRYEGLDRELRETCVEFDREPQTNEPGTVERLKVVLPPHGTDVLHVSITCSTSCDRAGPVLGFSEALDASARENAAHAEDDCEILTSNDLFDEWMRRSQSDLRMMTTETPHGRYPYAGVPWFSTAFGRDGLITALECLWVNPTVARGVLEYLAACQAKESDDDRDAEPGKILHETRRGEMAALGEIPFGRYYGSVDSTPLFVLLAGRYYRATADLAFAEKIWPAIEAALTWIDEYGDADGDGFIEYGRKTANGLEQQGWKDSDNSVFHADGSDATGPIAIAEAQAYVYAAKREAARLVKKLGDPARARELKAQAKALRDRFDEVFWCDDLGTYALALDGEKRPCRVRTSNAGHTLFTGIARPERAERLVQTLLSPESFSGWGVRTVAEGEARYNPMSYHNGSIWPHDNALIAQGLADYGYKREAITLLEGLYEVSRRVTLRRLPELFCGFIRRPGEGPTLYPVACSPQAWASASALMLLGAVLGIRIEAEHRRVVLERPQLPPWLEVVRLRRLRVGEGSVDLTLRRYPEDVALTVDRRRGQVEVVVLK